MEGGGSSRGGDPPVPEPGPGAPLASAAVASVSEPGSQFADAEICPPVRTQAADGDGGVATLAPPTFDAGPGVDSPRGSACDADVEDDGKESDAAGGVSDTDLIHGDTADSDEMNVDRRFSIALLRPEYERLRGGRSRRSVQF